MAGNSVRIHAGVKDEASGPIDRIRDKFTKLKEQGAAPFLTGAATAGSLMALGAIQQAIGGVTGAFSDSIRGAIDEEASLRRLGVAIGENDKAWDGNLDKINDVIEARQALGFADDEQRDSLAFLVSVTGSHTKALDLQRTAMDLARLKGMDLRTAGELLGKVFAGNLGTLSRYGIVLRDGATAQEALAEIQRRSAGQAEAFGETTAGAMEAANIAVDNLKEDFGKLLMPAIKEGADFLTKEAIPAIREFANVIGEAGRMAGDVASDVDEFFKPVSDALNGFVALGPALREQIFGVSTDLEDVGKSALAAYPSIGILFDALKEGIDLDPVPLEDSFASMFESVAEKGRAIGGEWGAMGQRLPRVFADGILKARQAPLDAMAELKELMKQSLGETAETTRLLGQLASEELAKGIGDKDGMVRNAAAGARNIVINRLQDLEVTPGTLSKKGMEALIAAMKAADPIVAKAAFDIYQQAQKAVPTSAEYKGWAESAMRAYAAAMGNSEEAIRLAAAKALSGAKRVFQAFSPPGPDSPLHEIDVWGYRTGEAWADGLADGIATAKPKLASELGALSAGFRSWEDAFTRGGLGAAQDFLNVEAARPTGGRYESPEPGVWNWVPDAPTGPSSTNGPMSTFDYAPSGYSGDAPSGYSGGSGRTLELKVSGELHILPDIADAYGDAARRFVAQIIPALKSELQREGIALS